MKPKKLQFEVSSRLKNIIGKDLITNDFIAVFELVKNSFDAHANEVEVIFKNIYGEKPLIIIKDDGKGMNYEELLSRWLVVAYSAKEEGTEDDTYDYRNYLSAHRTFAGSKGIGRFSCDRLGTNLYIETVKHEQNAKVETIAIDWVDFEQDRHLKFQEVEIEQETIELSRYNLNHGTVLEISGIRSPWDRDKILNLKSSLAKLVNPRIHGSGREFTIKIIAEEELKTDQQKKEYYDIVNGKVENLIFEELELKTTKISSTISENGDFVSSRLDDSGTMIYTVDENNEFLRLRDIQITLYYLNRAAKVRFTKRMGIQSVNYGHVYLYHNGFRIYPYGEPGEDPLKVDVRKAQGYARFIGTRELMGIIEINDKAEGFVETSSRGDGLIKTPQYDDLNNFFIATLKKLEKYVVEVQKWGFSIETDHSASMSERVSEFIEHITLSKNIIKIEYPENIIEFIDKAQTDSAESILKNIIRFSNELSDNKLQTLAEKANQKLKELQEARIEAEKAAELSKVEADKATKELEDQISENLFLKSINTSDYEEIISLLHHIGIYADTIDEYLLNITLRVQRGIQLTTEELYEMVRMISFEAKKIKNVTAFATKANFKLTTEERVVELNGYIKEYIENITPIVSDKSLKIKVVRITKQIFNKRVKPIELNLIIDNIVNNARKAHAKNLEIRIEENSASNMTVKFIDDGDGLQMDDIPKVFKMGFTRTRGSGLGLFYVKTSLDRLNSNVAIQNRVNTRGAILSIEFKSYEK